MNPDALETTVETIQRLLDSAYEAETGRKPPSLRLRWNELHEERVQRYRVHVDKVMTQLQLDAERILKDVKAWEKTPKR